jgi:hypothetical protein
MGAEAGLRQRIRTAIRMKNPDVLVVGQPAGGMTGRGRTDLYVIVAGRFVGLEIKTRTGRATQLQRDRIRDVRRAGGYAWLVRTPHAACVAVDIARKGEHMAQDELFDLDALLASFRPEDAEKPEPPEPAPSPPLAIPEEHIARRAIENGTAAGDGEALGEPPTPTAALILSIDALGLAVAELGDELRAWRAARAQRVEMVPPELREPLEELPEFPAPSPEPEGPPKSRRRRAS